MPFAQSLGKIGENRRKSAISRSGRGPGRKIVDFGDFDDFAQTLNKYHFFALLSYFKPLKPYVGNFKKFYVKKKYHTKNAVCPLYGRVYLTWLNYAEMRTFSVKCAKIDHFPTWASSRP